MIKHHNSYNGDKTLNNNTQTHRRTDCRVHLNAFPSYFSLTHHTAPHHHTPHHTDITSSSIKSYPFITQLLTFIFIFILTLNTARLNRVTETKLKNNQCSHLHCSLFQFFLFLSLVNSFYFFF